MWFLMLLGPETETKPLLKGLNNANSEPQTRKTLNLSPKPEALQPYSQLIVAFIDHLKA